MRKPPRRLWFGERRGDEEPADTVVITPEDGEEAPPAPVDNRRNVRRGAALAAVALLVALLFALTSSNENKLQPRPQAEIPRVQVPQAPQAPQGTPPQGFGGADLSGAEAEKAARAALRQFPGSIERVTRDSTGSGYIVHVISADGYEDHVLVSPDFHVLGSDGGGQRGSGGGGASQ